MTGPMAPKGVTIHKTDEYGKYLVDFNLETIGTIWRLHGDCWHVARTPTTLMPSSPGTTFHYTTRREAILWLAGPFLHSRPRTAATEGPS